MCFEIGEAVVINDIVGEPLAGRRGRITRTTRDHVSEFYGVLLDNDDQECVWFYFTELSSLDNDNPIICSESELFAVIGL